MSISLEHGFLVTRCNLCHETLDERYVGEDYILSEEEQKEEIHCSDCEEFMDSVYREMEARFEQAE